MSKHQIIVVRRFIMTEAVLDIKQWGNNLGVRLPAAVAREAHLYVDQRVRISVGRQYYRDPACRGC